MLQLNLATSGILVVFLTGESAFNWQCLLALLGANGLELLDH